MGINLTGVIGAVVKEALAQQSQKSTNDMKPSDVKTIEPAVTKAVEKEIAPIIENQTNNEPLWKSRVMRGTVGTIVVIAATAFADWYSDGVITTEAISGYVTAAMTAAYAVYGRLTSKAAPTI